MSIDDVAGSIWQVLPRGTRLCMRRGWPQPGARACRSHLFASVLSFCHVSIDVLVER